MNLITTREAAEILELTPRRVIYFVKDGRLTDYGPGNEILLDRAEVERFRLLPRPRGRPKKD